MHDQNNAPAHESKELDETNSPDGLGKGSDGQIDVL